MFNVSVARILWARNLTQGQMDALVLLRTMAAKAAGGQSRFAARFTALVANREWRSLAAVVALLSESRATPSPRDFRTVGRMSERRQDACLVLALVDAGRVDPIRPRVPSAPDFDLWDRFADAAIGAAKRAGYALNPENW